MRHGTYIGKQSELKGETAMLRPHVEDYVLAQFDNVKKFGPPPGSDPKTDDRIYYSHGWHEFREDEFEIDEEQPE